MKPSRSRSALLILATAPLLISTASANSSWVWVSETRPYDVLPFVIVITLLVEVLAIRYIANIQNLSAILWRVSLGNALSFAAPYLAVAASSSQMGYSFREMYEHLPHYHVGTVFLLLTLAVELPVVLSLRKYTEHKKELLFTIVTANVITTVFTAIVERTLCYGRW